MLMNARRNNDRIMSDDLHYHRPQHKQHRSEDDGCAHAGTGCTSYTGRLADNLRRPTMTAGTASSFLRSAFAVVAVLASCFFIDVIESASPENAASSVQQLKNGSSLIATLCRFPDIPLGGLEGQGVSEEEYDLVGLGVVFRHGERSPITVENVDDTEHHWTPSCAPFRSEDYKTFDAYIDTVKSIDFRKFFIIAEEHAKQDKYPQLSTCQGGQMTAEGALMHLHLGNYFRSRYAATRLFGEEAVGHVNVSAVASNFTRTFQSALAFSSAFLFPIRDVVKSMPIRFSNESFLCASDACACPPALQWRYDYEAAHLAFYRAESPRPLYEKSERIFSSIPSMTNKHDPFQYLDVALGRYACRHRPLPCTSAGECVNEQLLEDLLIEATRRGTVMFDDKRSSRLMTAEAQAVLGDVADMLDTFKSKEDRAIRIYSGHDVTVGPILRVLGLDFVDFPPYISRIAFEIYRKRAAGSSDLFLRLLYNGEDRTKELSFCGGAALCPVSAFQNFARKQLFANAGFQGVTDLCNK